MGGNCWSRGPESQKTSGIWLGGVSAVISASDLDEHSFGVGRYKSNEHEGALPDPGGSLESEDGVPGSRAEALERFASRPPFSTSRSDALHSYVSNLFEDLEDGTVRLRCRGSEEARVYDGERVSTNDKIRNCKATVVVGMSGDHGFGNLGEPAAEALDNSRTIDYEGLTHFGPLEAPDRLSGDALAALLGS